MTQINLPFKVGHTVEVKSFEAGYRGAWFRCKITKIYKKGRALFYNLDYLDFPDEGIHKTKVYQKLKEENINNLMIRPIRPPQYRENEIFNKEGGQEEALVLHDSWKVGDLVDWWKDECYWSGTVLEVGEDESVKIELLPQPYGQGGSYDGLSKDLHPSLEWSLEDGWIVPFSKDGEKRQCAKLMKLLNGDQVKGEETKEEQKQRPAQKLKGDGDEIREEPRQRPAQKFKGDGDKNREEPKQRPAKKLKGDLDENGEEQKQRPAKKLKGNLDENGEEQKQRPAQKLKGDGDENREEQKQRPAQKLTGDGDENREEPKQRPPQKLTGDGDENREEPKQTPAQKFTGDGDENREEPKQRPAQKLTGDGDENREEPTQRPEQKLKGDGDLRLNIMESESIKAAFVDIEETIVRLGWLQDMLAQDEPNSLETSFWKYEDYRPSSSRM